MMGGHSEIGGIGVTYPIPGDEEDHFVLNWIIRNQMDAVGYPIVYYSVDWSSNEPFKQCAIKWQSDDYSLNNTVAEVFVGYEDFPSDPKCVVMLCLPNGGLSCCNGLAEALEESNSQVHDKSAGNEAIEDTLPSDDEDHSDRQAETGSDDRPSGNFNWTD